VDCVKNFIIETEKNLDRSLMSKDEFKPILEEVLELNSMLPPNETPARPLSQAAGSYRTCASTGCTKRAADSTSYCKAHGGGRQCKYHRVSRTRFKHGVQVR